MEEILKNVESDIKKLESSISQKQKEAEQKQKQVNEKNSEIENLQKRLDKVSKEEKTLKNEYSRKREERQNALYNDQPVSEITKEIGKAQEKLELKSDEVASVDRKLKEVQADVLAIEEELTGLNAEIKAISDKKWAYQICVDYNKAARSFAEAVKNYYEFRNQNSRENEKYFAFGKDSSDRSMANISITAIAKLYVQEHQAIFYTYDKKPHPYIEGQYDKENLRVYPETWHWFKTR